MKGEVSARTLVAIVAGLASLTFAAAAIVLMWIGWSYLSPADPSPAGVPAASASPSDRSGSSIPTPSTEVTASPAASAPAASTVRSLSIPAANYHSEVRTMAIGSRGGIDPPDFQHSWWISDRGVIPSSSADDTTYFACHTNAGKSASAVPCNQVNIDNTPVGGLVVVETDTETVTYKITDVRQIPRSKFASDAAVWDVNPGRFVWVSCHLEDGRRSDFNFVIIGEVQK